MTRAEPESLGYSKTVERCPVRGDKQAWDHCPRWRCAQSELVQRAVEEETQTRGFFFPSWEQRELPRVGKIREKHLMIDSKLMFWTNSLFVCFFTTLGGGFCLGSLMCFIKSNLRWVFVLYKFVPVHWLASFWGIFDGLISYFMLFMISVGLKNSQRYLETWCYWVFFFTPLLVSKALSFLITRTLRGHARHAVT